MKILYVIPANLKDGKYTYSSFLKTEHIFLSQNIEKFEIFHFTKRQSLKGFISSLKDLNKRIQTFKPDLIHVNYGSTTSFLVLMSKKKSPWIISFGGSELLGHPNKGILWRIREFFAISLSKISANYATNIICVSKNLQFSLNKKNQKKCIVIPRGVDMDLFSIVNKKEPKNQLKIDNDKKTILFSLPRFNADVKNISLANNVVEILRKKYDIEFIIMNNISQDNIVKLMCSAACLLVTSKHEGSPNIVKEAMALNLPVVSVNCGDVEERLKNVFNSYVSKNYNENEIVILIEKVFANNKRSNGRSVLIKEGIDITSTTQKIIKVYKSLI